MAATTALQDRVLGSEAGALPDGAAFIDGAYVPIAEAKIPILDWGFLRSDCTYDVVHVWGGRFFRLDHHLDRFGKNVEALRLRLPYSRDEIREILMRLMRLTGLRDAYVELICTRGVPPKGSRDPRRCENRFFAFVIPFLWIATEEQRARGLHLHVSAIPRIPPQSVNPPDQELPLGRHEPRPVRGVRGGVRSAGAGRLRRQHRRGAGVQRVHGQGRHCDDARGHLSRWHHPADRAGSARGAEREGGDRRVLARGVARCRRGVHHLDRGRHRAGDPDRPPSARRRRAWPPSPRASRTSTARPR